MTDPTPTTTVTSEQIEALADAMRDVLDEMGHDSQSVTRYTKAKARLAYEPFMAMMEDGPEFYLALDQAAKIVRDTDIGR